MQSIVSLSSSNSCPQFYILKSCPSFQQLICLPELNGYSKYFHLPYFQIVQSLFVLPEEGKNAEQIAHTRTKNAPQYLSPISSYEVEVVVEFLGNYKQQKKSVSLLRIVAARLFAKTTLKRQ